MWKVAMKVLLEWIYKCATSKKKTSIKVGLINPSDLLQQAN